MQPLRINPLQQADLAPLCTMAVGTHTNTPSHPLQANQPTQTQSNPLTTSNMLASRANQQCTRCNHTPKCSALLGVWWLLLQSMGATLPPSTRGCGQQGVCSRHSSCCSCLRLRWRGSCFCLHTSRRRCCCCCLCWLSRRLRWHSCRSCGCRCCCCC